METNHTPEPWQFQKGINNIYESNSGITTAIAKMSDHQVSGGHAEAEANGLRIVACVNALAGLNPEGVRDAVEALRLLIAEVDRQVTLGNEKHNLGLKAESINGYTKAVAALAKLEDVK